MNLRHGILAGAFALLAVVAVAGWVRKAPAVASQPYSLNGSYTQPDSAQQPQPVPQTAQQYDSNGRPIYNNAGYTNTTTATTTTGATTTEPNPCVPAGSMGYPTAVYAAGYQEPYVSSRFSNAYRPVVVRRHYVVESSADRVVETRHPRSTKKSVAIVAGSAAAGAGIGALAGGGKGAGIGALAGGVGGFVYDRLTHNR